MHEQLIEALREEANNFAERFRSPFGGTDAKLIDIADALANVAARLERAKQGKAARFIVQGGKAGREYSVPVTTNDLNGTTWAVDLDSDELPLSGDSCETLAPSFYTVSGTFNGEKVSVHVDCTTGEVEIVGAEPNAGRTFDDDEPLTAEWLREVMPEVMGIGSECWLVVDRNDPPLLWFEAGPHRKSLNVTTRGEYRSLRKMLGIPMEASAMPKAPSKGVILGLSKEQLLTDPANWTDPPSMNISPAWLESVGFQDKETSLELQCRNGTIVQFAPPEWFVQEESGTCIELSITTPADIEAAIHLLGGVEE